MSTHSLVKQYFALVPPYFLHLPPPLILIQPDNQECLIQHIFQSSLPEPGPTYRRQFWRRIVGYLEDVLRRHTNEDDASEIDVQEQGREEEGDGGDPEVDERIYSALADLMALPLEHEETSYRTFLYPLGDTEARIILLEDIAVIQGGTTGLRTWKASLHLAHHIHLNTISLPPGPIVELGAGTGFLSIFLAQRQREVIATDLDATDGRQAPLKRLQHNVGMNHVEENVKVTPLDWADSLRPKSERPAVWEELTSRPYTVVAADVTGFFNLDSRGRRM
ncbi:hypothetical protein TREMEDRAFT_61209 [Tremella mesenterica DSM 1558]|uniref:uncharacterized protein n=1 Tax=Tremella mesenterica (strain ATCC 24925 / CBS 8224 / DSM 1558 / NBRC 9311 / NRRL Y-6157 / RJB 2259-6 / UBC 559-6) TaxID=578456 RepID=UPI0003F49D07|nr:uncharacterized protein TREMEDRAFT_61209 [Tremella mesenterica DSM 1558]EIW70698.1 hypothetical protein TREMEDRAFT_61209 [Tremella mesenterica DSM 1558]